MAKTGFNQLVHRTIFYSLVLRFKKSDVNFRFVPLWVGARGVEFDWKYIQMCFESNINLVGV